jgi:hypothetical protein
MNRTDITELANRIVGSLHELAEVIDPDYYEECADSGLTNGGASNDNKRIIRHLLNTSLVINASGLCEPRTEGEDILLAICGLSVPPLTYQPVI